MAILAFSRAKDGETRLSANFCVREFACRDGSDPVFVDEELVRVLQAIRTHFGRRVTVNSGFRTAAHNASLAVGGAAYSQHLYGRAADITVAGVDAREVAAYAETLLPQSGGIGVYPGFVHIDVRPQKARWKKNG